MRSTKDEPVPTTSTLADRATDRLTRVTVAPHERRIQGLRETAYLHFLEWAPSEDGHLGTVHCASFHHPTHGQVDAYVKMFPLSGAGHRGLINEITGWLLADALKLPQPDVAFIANIPLESIKPLKGWMKTACAGHKTWPAFCTRRVNARNAALSYNGDADSFLLRQDVSLWQECGAAIALDEHIANTDRHLNNLLRVGPRRYVLIDHDRLATDAIDARDWAGDRLKPDFPYTNRLSKKVWNDSPTDQLAGSTIDRARRHVSLLPQVAAELNHWACRLLPAEDFARWVHFLTQRTQHLEALLARRFHRLH